MSFDDFRLSKLRNPDILKSVTAVDQGKFEADILSKADKAYNDHICEERETLKKELAETTTRIKTLTESLKQLNECLIGHISSGRSSYDDFHKIRNSLQNQINAKKQELEKLSRMERRLKEQLRAQELSAQFSTILDEAGRGKAVVEEAGNESDDSGGSGDTMVFDPLKEESVESSLGGPEAKRARLEASPVAGCSTKASRPAATEVKIVDDADNDAFCERIIAYQNEQLQAEAETRPDENLGNGFFVPDRIWGGLYEFQQRGVRWLLGLHLGRGGGILGDEMGLGKTVQVLAFLAGLQRSRGPLYDCGPFLIVCPATVLRQWLLEFRSWAPLFRVAVLHSTGGGYDRPKRLIAAIVKEPGVLLTTYSSMVIHHALLTAHQWQYIVLDEGHKIKNPDTKTTHCAKKFSTPHRLILSGSPIQNNLKELWSLVDFVTPGRLGSLASFMQSFAVPIMKGGYEHASPLQVEAAYRCACVIRDTIDSSLLRRSKTEVRLQLPRKSEQVLFCGLTQHQALVYREYLASRQCRDIVAGKIVPFPGLVILRKICNHTDLVTGGPALLANHPVLGFARQAGEDRYGHFSRSGKMLVVQELLEVWFKGGHKVLLFTQGRMMLQILRRYLEYRGYPHLVMDGTTPVGNRHALVQQFNGAHFQEAFVFLLTTRVGGVGLNLTGADRVLVFDPDWNPCTDLQARERSWRIGQSKQVTIYRLVTTGTVEEKIYHRQVFKQFLTNRILKNPRQRRFFKTQDLYDLFRFDEKSVPTDTELMFHGDKNYRSLRKNYFDENPVVMNGAVLPDDEEVDAAVLEEVQGQVSVANGVKADEAEEEEEDEELRRLRRRARRLSKALGRLGSEVDEGSLQEEHRGDRRQEWDRDSRGQKIERPSGKSHRDRDGDCQGAGGTTVEGRPIANVRYRREHAAAPPEAERPPGAGGEHVVVATLAPRRAAEALSYAEARAADLVAARARRSLDLALSSAGVTGRLDHEAVVGDAGPDWAQEGALAEAAARSAVSWLLAGGREEASGGSLGSVRHCRLGAPSSRELLALVRARAPPGQSQGPPEAATALASQLLLFLAAPERRNRPLPSADIIAHFGDRVPPSRNLLFKALLGRMCSFRGGLWRLHSKLLLLSTD